MIGRTRVQELYSIGDTSVIAFDNFAEGVLASMYQTTDHEHANFGTDFNILPSLQDFKTAGLW